MADFPPPIVAFPPAGSKPSDYDSTIAFPPALPPTAPHQAGTGTLLPSGEYKLGLPTFPPAAVAIPAGDLETLIRDAFKWGNKMIVITTDNRGKFQTSMKRQDGNSFAVEVNDDVIASIHGALSILKL